MKKPRYIRDHLRECQILLARYGEDKEISKLLRRRLGAEYVNLAHAERMQGEYHRAAAAYFNLVCLGTNPLGAGLRAIAMYMPRPLLRFLENRKRKP